MTTDVESQTVHIGPYKVEATLDDKGCLHLSIVMQDRTEFHNLFPDMIATEFNYSFATADAHKNL